MYKQYEAFENAEEVWLWYCACLEARREGLRSRGDYQGPERPCEISDIERIVKYLRRQGKLRLRQLNTMYRWGAMHCSPYCDRRAGRIEVRLWDEGLRCLEPLLRSKGIIIAEEE